MPRTRSILELGHRPTRNIVPAAVGSLAVLPLVRPSSFLRSGIATEPDRLALPAFLIMVPVLSPSFETTLRPGRLSPNAGERRPALDARLARILRNVCRRCVHRLATRQTARRPGCGQRAE